MGITETAMSQYFLKLKTDSIGLETDSVMLFTGEYRGEMIWQVSSDLINWSDLDLHSDTIVIGIDSTAYYRAVVKEGTCNLVVSDTAYVIEQLTITENSEFTVDSGGGVFLLPSGIKVKIPPGAVTGPTEIKVEAFDWDGVNDLAEAPCNENSTYITGFSIESSQLNFLKPVKVRMPVSAVPINCLPVLFELRDESSGWQFSKQQIIVRPQNHFIEFVLNNLEQENTGLKNTVTNSVVNFFLNLYGNIFLGEDSCREKDYDAYTNEPDYQHSSGCIIIKTQVDITYKECKPSQMESFIAQELTKECAVSLTILPMEHILARKNEPQKVSLKTMIQNEPLSNQSITVRSVDDIVIISQPQETDAEGNTYFEFYSTSNNGPGRIFITVNYFYYLTTIYAATNRDMVYLELDPVQLFLDTAITVFAYDECTDISLLDCSQINNAACEQIREKLITRVAFSSEKDAVAVGESVVFKLEAFNYKDVLIEDVPGIEWVSVDEAVATVANGLVTGASKGYTTIKSGLCEKVYEADIRVYDKPEVTTLPVTNIRCETANAGGEVVSDNNDPVTERGVMVGGVKYSSGSGEGAFSIKITGLNPNTTYNASAFATNQAGTSYGDPVSFKTKPEDECDDDCVKVTTASTSNIQCDRLDLGGHVSGSDEVTIVEYGVFSGISPKPEVTGTKYKVGEGTGPYTATFIMYLFNTTFYVKAYALGNDGKMYYGEEIEFIMERETVTDIEGNVYTTTTIGNQVWMGENMRTRTLNDGTPIPFVIDVENNWYGIKTPLCCLYNNHEPNEAIFGILYNFWAVQTGQICPTGWHVPSENEWNILTNYLIVNGYNYDSTRSENKIAKAMAATRRWYSSSVPGSPGHNIPANNSSCFSALPGGRLINWLWDDRGFSAKYYRIGYDSRFWTSTTYNMYDYEYKISLWYKYIYRSQ